jgi:myo-inositol catabolism protein IolC
VITIGYPGPLYLLTFASREGQVELSEEHREVVGDAVGRLLVEGTLGAEELAVLVDGGEGPPGGLRDHGVVRALTVGGTDSATLELELDEGFGDHLEHAGAAIARIDLTWNPGQPPESKKSQVMRLTKLAAWVHETDRKLLLDLGVPPVATDLEQVGGDQARYRTELRPGLVRRAVQEIRELGVEADVWVTEPAGTVDELAELSDLAREAGREDVALLLPDGTDEAASRAAAELTGYRGFAAGRSIWAEPLAALDAANASRDEAVGAIAAAFRRRLEPFGTTPHG